MGFRPIPWPRTAPTSRRSIAGWSAKTVPIIKTARNDLLGVHRLARGSWCPSRSTARQLSSFRRFFRYLLREGMIREDPTAQIAMPKIGRVAAEVTDRRRGRVAARWRRPSPIRSVTAIARCSRSSTPPACSVSELINLKHEPGEPEPGRAARSSARAIASGSIPLGEEAQRLAQRVRQRPARRDPARASDGLSCSRPAAATSMTRQAFWHIIKRYARKAGVQEGAVAAHGPSRVRHAPAEPRRGPARGADACSGTATFRPPRSIRTSRASA